jgi:hypothetical protein
MVNTEMVVCFQKADDQLEPSQISLKDAITKISKKREITTDEAKNLLLCGDLVRENGNLYSIDLSRFAEKPVEPEIIETLSEEEVTEFDKLEEIVENHGHKLLDAARQIGEALTKIKEKKYYRKLRPGQEHPIFKNFGDYVKFKYGRGRTMAHNYVVVYETMKLLQQNGSLPEGTDSANISTILAVSKDVKKIVDIKNLTEEDAQRISREFIVKGWQMIVDTAPKDDVGKPILTPEHVHISFDVLSSVMKSGVVEIDGEQIPVSLATLATNDQIVQTLYEQVQTRRQHLGEKIERQKARRLETINFHQTPTEVASKELFSINCPKHGKVMPTSLIRGGFKASCGCIALIEIVNAYESTFIRQDDSKT